MKLRDYRKEDSPVICSWVKDEKTLYYWSSMTFDHFPLCGDELDREYEIKRKELPLYPLTATDDDDNPVGHLFLICPYREDEKLMRIGFVIVDPEKRGKGYGREMLKLAVEFGKEKFGAEKANLGVYDNNSAANKCYEAIGFLPTGKKTIIKLPTGDEYCTEMEKDIKDYNEGEKNEQN